MGAQISKTYASVASRNKRTTRDEEEEDGLEPSSSGPRSQKVTDSDLLASPSKKRKTRTVPGGKTTTSKNVAAHIRSRSSIREGRAVGGE